MSRSRGEGEAAIRKRVPPPPPPTVATAARRAHRDQLGLAWTGDFSGLIDGDFDEKTVAAVKAFQRNHKFRETGLLNTQERALLAASARPSRARSAGP